MTQKMTNVLVLTPKLESSEEMLFEAILQSDISSVRQILTVAPQLVSARKLTSEMTPCLYAAFLGNEDILEFLIDLDGNTLEDTDAYGRSVFELTLISGSKNLSIMIADRMGRNNVKLSSQYTEEIDQPYEQTPMAERYIETEELIGVHEDSVLERRNIELFRTLVGTSSRIRKVRKLIAQVADTEVNVLITGESGTGKEVVARNIHYHSSRRDKPFVPINLGVIPDGLMESTLYGHEKGAFTGAVRSKAGLVEMAEGGTLFLDEIGYMTPAQQASILRFIQEGTFERLGSNKVKEANVRIVLSTNLDLSKLIEEVKFREDLYFRISAFPIEMPALRERSEDIPLIINELVSRLETEKRGSVRFNTSSLLALCACEWAGNVRELANVVERMAILHPYGVIGVKDLPEKYQLPTDKEEDGEPKRLEGNGKIPRIDLPEEGINLKGYMSELESSLIQQALDDSKGVVNRAAERLHIRRVSLIEKMRKYGINVSGKRTTPTQ